MSKSDAPDVRMPDITLKIHVKDAVYLHTAYMRMHELRRISLDTSTVAYYSINQDNQTLRTRICSNGVRL